MDSELKKGLESGIILDNTTITDFNPNKEDKKEKEAKLNEKIAAIKAKAQEKQEKELEKKKAEQEKASQKAQADVGLNANNTSNNFDPNPELTAALVAYKKKDFATAFHGFSMLAEANDEVAAYMLSNIFHRGEGVPNDEERAEFWMKRSADLGYVTAQFDYAMLKLSVGTSDDTVIEEAMYYLGLAADGGEKKAQERYIEVAKGGHGGRNVFLNAMNYCDRLIATTNDSFDIELINADKAEIEKYLNEANYIVRRQRNIIIYNTVGLILKLLAVCYLFGGMHPVEWEINSFFKYLPDAFSFLLIQIPVVSDAIVAMFGDNGYLGFELMGISAILLELGNVTTGKKLWQKLNDVVNLVWAGMLFWNFYVLVTEGRKFYTSLGWIIFFTIVYLYLGTKIGEIIKKISRKVCIK